MKDEKVYPHDVVTVVATGNAQYMVKGSEYVLHKIAAQKLIDAGKAVKK